MRIHKRFINFENLKMELIQAFIFDLDGVIVDTAKYHFQAWNRLAKSLGFEITEEENERLKGVSRMESLELILELGGIKKSQDEKELLAEKKNKWYLEYIHNLKKSEILPGIEDLLEDLQDKGIKIALGSASKNSRPILERIGLVPYFDVIVDGNMTTKSKPDPEVFLKGAEMLGLAPANCVVIEDSIKGVEAANLGGFKSVAIGDEPELQIADIVYPNTRQLRLENIRRSLSVESLLR